MDILRTSCTCGSCPLPPTYYGSTLGTTPRCTHRSLARSLVPLLKIRRNPSTTRASSERCQNEGEEEEDGDPTDDLNVSIMRGFVHDNESSAVRITNVAAIAVAATAERSHRPMRSPLAIADLIPFSEKR